MTITKFTAGAIGFALGFILMYFFMKGIDNSLPPTPDFKTIDSLIQVRIDSGAAKIDSIKIEKHYYHTKVKEQAIVTHNIYTQAIGVSDTPKFDSLAYKLYKQIQ